MERDRDFSFPLVFFLLKNCDGYTRFFFARVILQKQLRGLYYKIEKGIARKKILQASQGFHETPPQI